MGIMSESTEVLYARVPSSTKARVDEYAEQNGLSIAGAVAYLLDIGLGSKPRQPVYARLAEIEERLDKLERA